MKNCYLAYSQNCNHWLQKLDGIFDHNGKRIFTLNTNGKSGHSIVFGNMTGDGISYFTLVTIELGKVLIFKNENGKKTVTDKHLGCGVNFTYY